MNRTPHTKYLLLTMAVFGCFFAQAQPIDFDQLQKLNIHSVGPAHMSGRITAIDAVTSNAKTIYVGGVWK